VPRVFWLAFGQDRPQDQKYGLGLFAEFWVSHSVALFAGLLSFTLSVVNSKLIDFKKQHIIYYSYYAVILCC